MSADRRRNVLIMSIKLDTLFLDRDGVINKKIEKKYIDNVSDFYFIPGVLFAIGRFTSMFNRIIVVTNQQGLGKGIMSVLQLNKVHSFMNSVIEENGGKIDRIYYCPHLSTNNCECRKPRPGMIKQAINDFPNIDLMNSYLVGDSESDIEAGKRLNLNTIKLDENYTLYNWYNDIINRIE